GVVKHSYVLNDMDYIVGSTYDNALTCISNAGARLRGVQLKVLDALPDIFANGGLVAAEAFQWHRDLLSTREAGYDPRVSVRIKRGSLSSAADYVGMVARRRELVAQWEEEAEPYDAIVMPTIPII